MPNFMLVAGCAQFFTKLPYYMGHQAFHATGWAKFPDFV